VQQAGSPLALLAGLDNLQELVLREAHAAALDKQGECRTLHSCSLCMVHAA
jgi:ferredoxin